MTEGASIQALIRITVASAVVPVPAGNTVPMVPASVRLAISSATAHALTRTSMTTTAVNAEMFVHQARAVLQALALNTSEDFETEKSLELGLRFNPNSNIHFLILQ